MLNAIEMMPALKEFQQRADQFDPENKAVDHIPSEDMFTVLKHLKPTLLLLKQYYDVLLTEGIVSHRYLVDMVNMGDRLAKQKLHLEDLLALETETEKKEIRECAHFVDALMTKQAELMNMTGLLKGYMMMSAVFHPCYKGVVLLEPAAYRDFLDVVVRKHEEQQPEPVQRPSPFDRYTEQELSLMSLLERRMIEFEANKDDYLLDPKKDNISPLRKELQEYCGMAPASSDVDVLKWWFEKKDQFPLLSQLARQYLPLAVTSTHHSTDKERPGFKRWKDDESDPPFLARLMFIQENAGRLPMKLDTWTYEIAEVCK